MTIGSHIKKKEEIVARHLKEEESINPSLDQDPDQDTDRFHTIEKDQTGVKEEGQDPQGIRDGQGQCHVQYLQEGVQKYVPKQNPLGIRDGQGHRHVQYLQEGIQKYVPKQDPQGIIDIQGHCHVHYVQEAVQKYVPKQDPQGIIDIQGQCHVQYLQEGI